MNEKERIKMLEAMDFIVRHFNDEDAIGVWLTCGLPDGTVESGTTNIYTDDESFADIMDSFVYIMSKFCDPDDRRGTLACDGVLSMLR